MTNIAPLNLLFGLSALASMLPAAILGLRHGPARGTVFWALIAVAAAGPSAYAIAQLGRGALPSLSTALWLSVSASLVLYLLIALAAPAARRLTPLLLPYLVLMGAGALVAGAAPDRGLAFPAPAAW